MSAAAPPAPAPADPPARPDPAGSPAPALAPGRLWLPVGRGEVLALAGLTLASALLRLNRLAELPPGLHVDEAYNILDAWAVMEGWRPVFLPANAGREVLYSYLQAALLALDAAWLRILPEGLAFGLRDPWLSLRATLGTARRASALAGIATVPLVWGMTRVLLADMGLGAARVRRGALLAAGLLSFLFWHLHFSRFGIRAILFPALVCALLWAWRIAAGAEMARDGASGGRGIATGSEPSGRQGWAATAVLAVLLGLGFYTHPAGRGLVAIPLLDAGYRWLRWRETRPWRMLALAGLGMLLVAAPLLSFWATHPWLFTGHAEEVSVLGQGPAALAANAGRVVGMFNLAGDPARWRNLPGRPVFDPLTGLAFLLGLTLALRAAARGARGAALALVALVVLLVPSVVTDAAPNFSRAIGALPLACLLAALGMDAVAATLERGLASRGLRGRGPSSGRGRWSERGPERVAAGMLVAWLALAALASTRAYFVTWARHPDTPAAFDAEKMALGLFYRAVDTGAVRAYRDLEGARLFLSPTMAEHPTVRVAAGGVPPAALDPRHGSVFPSDLEEIAALVLLPGEAALAASLAARPDAFEAPRTVHADPDGLLAIDRAALPALSLHRIKPAPSSASPPSADGIDLGPYARLLDAAWPEQVRAGATAPITLTWEVLQPSPESLHTAIQLRAPDGAALGEGDGPPLGGSYPTDRWRPGERIVSYHTLRVAPDAVPGPAEIWLGWYAPPEGERPFAALVLGAEGETVVELGRIEVGRRE